MFRSTLVALAATVSLAATPTAAATIADVYSSFWVFGDSLSDNGNVAAAFAAQTPPVSFPPPPYFDGRFSNGPVWNDGFLADFGPTTGANFAFGGARTFNDGDQIPDLPAQIGAFAAVLPGLSLGDRPLASVFFGANDMFDAITLAAADPATAFATLAARATATVQNIAAGVTTLRTLGIGEFAIWNLPDLGTTPRLRDLGPQAQLLGSAATTIYNSAFETMLAGLRLSGAIVHKVDTFGLFLEAAANPAAFGLANLTDACLPVDPFRILQGDPVPAPCAAPDTFLYWDQLHPTRVGHDALAAAFDASVPAIPLPAPALLLVVGLGGLAALRRRRAA